MKKAKHYMPGFLDAESEGVEPMLSIACPIRDLFLKVANAPNDAPDKT